MVGSGPRPLAPGLGWPPLDMSHEPSNKHASSIKHQSAWRHGYVKMSGYYPLTGLLSSGLLAAVLQNRDVKVWYEFGLDLHVLRWSDAPSQPKRGLQCSPHFEVPGENKPGGWLNLHFYGLTCKVCSNASIRIEVDASIDEQLCVDTDAKTALHPSPKRRQ